LLVVLGLGLCVSTGLSSLSCVSAVVMHILAFCLRGNKVDYYYYLIYCFIFRVIMNVTLWLYNPVFTFFIALLL